MVSVSLLFEVVFVPRTFANAAHSFAAMIDVMLLNAAVSSPSSFLWWKMRMMTMT